jgi:hypothetical protein
MHTRRVVKAFHRRLETHFADEMGCRRWEPAAKMFLSDTMPCPMAAMFFSDTMPCPNNRNITLDDEPMDKP